MGPIRRVWKANDEFSNGFLGRGFLEDVIDRLDTDKSLNVNALVDDLFEGNPDAVTFSSLVKILAERTSEKDENVSLLQYFYDKNN